MHEVLGGTCNVRGDHESQELLSEPPSFQNPSARRAPRSCRIEWFPSFCVLDFPHALPACRNFTLTTDSTLLLLL